MQNEAKCWRNSFLRIKLLANKQGTALRCEAPPWSRHEIKQQIAILETVRGICLPASYKEFLYSCDGCQNLFHGAGLYSVAQLLDPACAQAVDGVIADFHTPVPCYSAPVKPDWRQSAYLCIGTDPTGDIVFVLDTGTVYHGGEMDVIAWFSGIGLRFPSFAHLLEFIADLVEQHPTESMPIRSVGVLAAGLAA